MKRKLIFPVFILFVLSLSACNKDEIIIKTHEVVGNGLIEAHKMARRAHDAKLMTDGKYRQICASLRRASVLYSASCDALKLYINKEENDYIGIISQINIIVSDVVTWIWEKE